MRRSPIAVAAALPLLLLTACGQGTPKVTSPTITATTTSGATTTSSPPAASVPEDFKAQSVTFVSSHLGWVLGTTSCLPAPASSCARVLLRTEDAGRTWARVPAPVDGNVNEVRFASADDGWVWAAELSVVGGPDLWATHDGGLHWQRPPLPGVPPSSSISDVEAAAGIVAASFNGDPIEMETSPVHVDGWKLSSMTLPVGAGPVPNEQIVLQGRVGWVIDVDRTVLGGARLLNGGWVPWTPPCSKSGGPAMIAASDTSHLVAVCEEGVYTSSTPSVRVYFSGDGASTFQPVPTSPPAFPPDATGIASPAPGVVIMGGNGGDLIGTFDKGATWHVVNHQADSVVWLQVGFTTPSQGVAIDGNGRFLMTFDGGHVWALVAFSPARALTSTTGVAGRQ